jgi:hypothetical protein
MQLRTTLTNVAGQTVHVLNNTASQFATHSPTLAISGLPIAARLGFVPGLMVGASAILDVTISN